jgi:hypothetical protein
MLLLLSLIVVTIASAGVARAQDKNTIAFNDLDKKIVKSCYDATLLGTEIFNNKNYEGCYRLYQGTLLSLQPILDYRPELATMTKERLERAKTMKPWDGAFELRIALDEIQNRIAPVAKSEPKADVKPQSLYERLGGTSGLTKMLDTILIIGTEDKKVNLLHGKKLDPKEMDNMKSAALDYVSSITNGPRKYTPMDKAQFANLSITSDEYTALMPIIEKTLANNKVDPRDIKEFLAILEAQRKDIVDTKK